jgi:membrane-associated phospholipid phosphatase
VDCEGSSAVGKRGGRRGSTVDAQTERLETASRPVVRRRTRLASLIIAAGVATFGLLAWLVGSGLSAEPDLAMTLGLQQASHPALVWLMVVVSFFGFQPQNVVIVVVAAAFFWLKGQRREGIFVLLAAGGMALIGTAFKLLLLRPRPEGGVVQVLGSAAGYSFPSGHVLLYVSFFGFLFYWAYAVLGRSLLRSAALWLCGLLIVLVGPSRVYLGHHWSSDVLAAYALGLSYLLLLIRLYSAAGPITRDERSRADASP